MVLICVPDARLQSLLQLAMPIPRRREAGELMMFPVHIDVSMNGEPEWQQGHRDERGRRLPGDFSPLPEDAYQHGFRRDQNPALRPGEDQRDGDGAQQAEAEQRGFEVDPNAYPAEKDSEEIVDGLRQQDVLIEQSPQPD
jgi:hypothetical protein